MTPHSEDKKEFESKFMKDTKHVLELFDNPLWEDSIDFFVKKAISLKDIEIEKLNQVISEFEDLYFKDDEELIDERKYLKSLLLEKDTELKEYKEKVKDILIDTKKRFCLEYDGIDEFCEGKPFCDACIIVKEIEEEMIGNDTR